MLHNTYKILIKPVIRVENIHLEIVIGFLFNMNYQKIYNQIVKNRLKNPISENEYGESHHIVPKSLGGSNDVKNIVRLTAREHFICHALLAEMYEENTPEWYKMNNAFMMMKSSSTTHTNNRYFNSKLYELKRKDFSKVMSNAQSGSRNSQYGKVWIYNTKLKQSIKICEFELAYYLQNDWVKGRILNFDTFDKKIKKIKIAEKNKKYYNGKLLINILIKKIENIFNVKNTNQIELIETVKTILYNQYVVCNKSTNDLAKEYNSTNPTIRSYLIWLGIGTKNRAGKWS